MIGIIMQALSVAGTGVKRVLTRAAKAGGRNSRRLKEACGHWCRSAAGCFERHLDETRLHNRCYGRACMHKITHKVIASHWQVQMHRPFL